MPQLSMATLTKMRGAALLLTLPCNSADVSLIIRGPICLSLHAKSYYKLEAEYETQQPSFTYRLWAAEGNKEQYPTCSII
ncbi:hypothetical protein T06_3983 [Trichinella sp. T6]|nr:hypothetical protein T06_3983 [Trichinella sp. T6]